MFMNDCEDRLSSTSTMSQEEQIHKFKTEMCKFYGSDKPCPYGIKCYFAHGENELFSKVVSKNYRTKPCINFITDGYCKYGFRCQFAHPTERMKLTPLKYWNNIENIQVGSMKKKHRLKIFKQLTSGVYGKTQETLEL